MNINDTERAIRAALNNAYKALVITNQELQKVLDRMRAAKKPAQRPKLYLVKK